MCIRDRPQPRIDERPAHRERTEVGQVAFTAVDEAQHEHEACLLYTSDAADERSSVDLGGRRIIKKKTRCEPCGQMSNTNNTTHS